MTASCSYAGCRKPGRKVDPAFPEWQFCRQHWKEHRADIWGEPWPKLSHDPTYGSWVALVPVVADDRPGSAICGTRGGYARHRRNKEGSCGPCKAAEEVAMAAYNAARREARLQPCGTRAAAQRHRFNDEPLCDACRLAKQNYDNSRNRAARMYPAQS